MSANKLALDALKNCRREMRDWHLEHPATKQTDAAIAALEAAQVEPVAEKFEADCDRIGQAIDIGREALTELRRVKAINADLLAVLKALVNMEIDYTSSAMRNAKAAIARATGEAP